MKKIISLAVPGICLLMLLCAQLASAQGTKKSGITKVKQPGPEMEAGKEDKSTISVHSRAIEEFNKTYGDATGQTWSATERGFIAIFQENGARSHAYYNKKGRWYGTIRYLYLKDIPENIREQVKFHFPAYKLGIAQELTLPYELFYLLYLENGNSYKRLRYVNGQMDIIEEAQK